MKKTISLFFEEAPLWQIFFACFFLFSLLIFALLRVIQNNMLISLKLSFSLSVLIGLIIIYFISLIRKSITFWEMAKNLESKINDSENKISLDNIFNEDFQNLKKISLGDPHSVELRRLYTIMKTKYKYVK